MRQVMILARAGALAAFALVAGCSSQYASRQECERGEAAYRGGVIGFVAGSALAGGGRRVVRENGRTVTKDGGAGLLGAGLGTLLGRGAGVLAHELSSSGTPDDPRPHEGDWLGRCRLKP